MGKRSYHENKVKSGKEVKGLRVDLGVGKKRKNGRIHVGEWFVKIKMMEHEIGHA